MRQILFKMLLLFFASFLLVGSIGCERRQVTQEELNNEFYQKGHSDGLQKGYEEGMKEGYKQIFQKTYPGRDPRLLGFWGDVQRILIYLGAFKIILALFFIIGYLLNISRNAYEGIGKVLMGGLGSIIIFWTANIFGFSDEVRGFLLTSASETIMGWLITGIIAAFITYLLFFLFRKLFMEYDYGPQIEAWCIFIASASLTVLIPAFLAFLKDTPDINRYLASEIIVGSLIGGIYYLARLFIIEAIKQSPNKSLKADAA